MHRSRIKSANVCIKAKILSRVATKSGNSGKIRGEKDFHNSRENERSTFSIRNVLFQSNDFLHMRKHPVECDNRKILPFVYHPGLCSHLKNTALHFMKPKIRKENV